MANMMQDPAMQQMMQNVLSNPQMLEQALRAHPQASQVLESNPQLREALNNPEMLRQLMDPANLQAMAQLQSSFGANGAGGPTGAGFDPLGMGMAMGGMQSTP